MWKRERRKAEVRRRDTKSCVLDILIEHNTSS